MKHLCKQSISRELWVIYALYLVPCTLLLLLFSGCGEKSLDPINEASGKPEAVTNVETVATPGGVYISYDIPNEEDILGVKAVFTLQDGQERELVSSYYQTHLTIKGYNDTETHSARLYVVNRAQELSDPVEVTFVPLKSSLQKVVESFSFISDFGGAKFYWQNEDKENLYFEFLGENADGELGAMKIIASQSEDASESLRGYDTNPHRFGAIISDRWENVSDTLYPEGYVITPLFEEQLDYTKIEILSNNVLPASSGISYPYENDVRWDISGWASGNSAYSMFDGNKDTWSHTYNGTVPGAAVTLDLHAVIKLSRLHTIQRDYAYTARVYAQGNVEEFEVWGALEKPAMNGKWAEAGWTKLADFETVKPSESTLGTVTDEDLSVAASGHEFPFDITLPAVRYIRIRVNKTFGSTSNCYFAEVGFFGEMEYTE